MIDVFTMTLEEFVEHALVLRKRADEAEKDLLDFLYEAEDAGIHNGPGVSFTELISRNNICRPERYAKYKRVRECIGQDAIEDVGTHGVIAAADFNTPEAQKNVIESAKRWEKSNDRPISEESAKRISKEQKIRHNAQRDTLKHGRNRSWDELVAIEERLLKENAQLKETITLLKAELRDAKKQLAQANKSAKVKSQAEAAE